MTIGTGSKTLTVGTGLSYSIAQTVLIAYDASNTMEGAVTSYNAGNGSLVVNVTTVSGSGTQSDWDVNLAGASGGDGTSGSAGSAGSSGSSGNTGTSGSAESAGTAGSAGTSDEDET